MSSAQDSIDGTLPKILVDGGDWVAEEPKPIRQLTFDGVTSVADLHVRAAEIYGPMKKDEWRKDTDELSIDAVLSGLEDAIWTVREAFGITVADDPVTSRELSAEERSQALLESLKAIRSTTAAGDAHKHHKVTFATEIAEHNLPVSLQHIESGEMMGTFNVPRFPGECALWPLRYFWDNSRDAGSVDFTWESRRRTLSQVAHMRRNLHKNAKSWTKAQQGSAQASA